ncbi:MAG: protein O-mannosyl-transferase family [Polyangiales bacterium]
MPVWLTAAVALGWLAAPDVGFRDSGEIGAAGFGLGIAHPTGFAVDLLLLRFASLVPLGHIGWRQNALVGLEAATALGLLAAICDLSARRLDVHSRESRAAGALLAAIGLGAFRTFFETAVAVEVYSLAVLAVLLAAYGWARGGAARGLCMLVLGFSPGLHVSAGLLTALIALAAFAWLGPRSGFRFAWPRLSLIVAGALIITYLPLASMRDPPLDWGDPQTPSRILAHLTAARIRGAYQHEMLSADPTSSFGILAQLWELWPLLPPALLALVIGWSRNRLVVLAPLGLLTADLAYAAFINPMGAEDRQVGHAAGAGLALLAGLGVALVSERCQRPALRVATMCGAAALALISLWRFPVAELGDGYAAAELFGSGGPLAAVPARAILVCSTDDACAGSLFALYVERVRPDVDTAPAQHLWDPTVVRRFSAGVARAEPPPPQRAAAADREVRALVAAGAPRPVLFESAEPVRRAGRPVALMSSSHVPYLVQSATGASVAGLTSLDRLRLARFVTGRPSSDRARTAWSQVYGTLGEQALGTALGVQALRVATQIAPARAAAWINLGVALEATGDLASALQSAQRAIDLAPSRPTAWVNATRLVLRLQGPDAARRLLDLAAQAGVRDPRLLEIERTL